MLMFAFLF